MPCTSIFSFFDFFGLFLCLPEHLAIFQEKIKEKESRKTQTFKKDEDKKKKLMQSEVQVSYYLLLVWESLILHQAIIYFVLRGCVTVNSHKGKCERLKKTDISLLPTTIA